MTSAKCHFSIFVQARGYKQKIMFKNKNDTLNNISGKNIKRIRLEQVPRLSQRALADKLQIQGIDLDKNAVQRIESGQRFVTDIELLAFSKVLNVSLDVLLQMEGPSH